MVLTIFRCITLFIFLVFETKLLSLFRSGSSLTYHKRINLLPSILRGTTIRFKITVNQLLVNVLTIIDTEPLRNIY